MGVGKCPKMAQNPTRQVHALLARFCFARLTIYLQPTNFLELLTTLLALLLVFEIV